MAELRRILITGSAGNMGRMLRDLLARPGRTVRLLDVAPVEPPRPGEDVEIHTGSFTDPDTVRAACAGVDAIVHLGGLSREAPWADILHTNVHGTWCLLEAAREAGIKRIVLASSNHAVGFASRADAPADGLPADLAPRPDTYYGWSKAAIESLARLYVDRFGMDILCLRIGSCFPRPTSPRGLSTWLSPQDARRLLEACLTTAAPGFRLVWGVSANTRAWWSTRAGQAIGFRPEDNAERYAADIPGAEHATLDSDERVGGEFCTFTLGERESG
jgi:uronate dehydrogenase